MKKKVALIFGGRSLESDISVITAMQVLRNIDKAQYLVELVFMFEGDFYVKNLDDIKQFAPFNPLDHAKAMLYRGVFYTIKRNAISKYFKPDIAFICCHGGEGENGTLQAILEFNGVPHTSAGVLGSAVGMDKAHAKEMFDSMLFNIIPHETITRQEFVADHEKVMFHLESFLNYPLIVKPSAQGSSIGIGVANNREELMFALEVASKFDNKIIVEQKLTDFVEVNCAAFRDGNEIVLSETEQPVSYHDFLTFEDKYMVDGKMSESGHQIPAPIGNLEMIILANTERVYRELDLNGVIRVDYLVDKTRNKVYINEINTVPGSMAFYLFEPRGISFKMLTTKLLENAVTYFDERRIQHIFKTNVLCQYKGTGKIRK
ncbi:MAG: D-alanine--D-alanine ligase [Clostridia bacterium]